ncbi:MAG: DMT family transporter [Heliobacteriaceae bacterium]|nr:DMT family transporter [Heliobacteriaceae bacterium]MDD4588525.1 DMT family transporter [Heliobacteriaceae bacterium]
MPNQFALGIVMVILSAVGFGLMPIFALYAYQYGVSVVTLLFLRFAVAALVLFGFSFNNLRNLHITKKELTLMFLLGGVLYTLQSTFFFSAVKYIPASLAALLLYAYPIFVSILTVVLGKDLLNIRTIGAIIIAFAGLILVLKTSLAGVNLLGVGLALGAAVVYSVYIVIGSGVVKNATPVITTAFVSLFAAISLLVMGLVTNSLNFQLPFPAYLFILAVALVSTVLAIVTFFTGVKIIGPTRASIISMLEPLVTVACAFVFFQEQLTWLQIIGGLIVLAGGVIVATENRSNPQTS